ncbi:MAG: hypothetical protein CVU52_05160 [Deltaproteobacteria bacterium HGW-Deltaproteobacteria-10]|jgi:uncharacterized protein YebE (UPF0316 family)|nr:MAG: hypothetical protein CVU52_05160 [Deltaproteobacteria bacterium HGW-Deltaproteobacteria-10]PKN96492.1 MAG: hypothetical protein CVU43_20420 [Chloroflexi bacterium HGW-Chloroflexi-5]
MDIAAIYHSEIFKFVILPVLIFSARICDVTLDTLRIIYVSRGMKVAAPMIGFFEVLIWLMAISQIFQNLSNPVCYIAYAGGFAMGNFIGIILEEKMAIGTVVIRIITQRESMQLIEVLKTNRYGVTHVDAQGVMGPVKIIFTIVKRKDIDRVLRIVRACNPLAFFTIEDVRSVRKGVFPLAGATDKKHGASAGR